MRSHEGNDEVPCKKTCIFSRNMHVLVAGNVARKMRAKHLARILGFGAAFKKHAFFRGKCMFWRLPRA